MNSKDKYHFHKNEYLIQLISKKSKNLFLSKQLMCSETVLTTLNTGLSGGLDPMLAVRLASGLSEGIGGSGCTCGALTGGIISLGLFLGRATPGWTNNKTILRLSKKLHNSFKNTFGSTCCRVLSKNLKHGSKEHFKKGADIVGFTSKKTAQIIFDEKPALMDVTNEFYLKKSDSMATTIFKKTIH